MSRDDVPNAMERKLLAIKQGAQQALAGGKTITFGGKSFDQAGLVQAVDALLAPFVNVRQVRTTLAKGVGERRAAAPERDRFVRLLGHATAAAFGEDSVEFSLLGFHPRKQAVALTPEQKQHKLEQLRATRLARHTMGKRQKQAVKGDVSNGGGSAGSPATPAPVRTSGTSGGDAAKP